MAVIRQDNIIVTLDYQAQQAKTDLRKTRDEIVGISDAAKTAKADLVEAFEDDVIKNYFEVLKATGVEIGDLNEAAGKIRAQLRSSFDTEDPEQYLKSLSRLSLALSVGEANAQNFADKLAELRQDVDIDVQLRGLEDPLIDKYITKLQETGQEIKDIEKEAELARQALRDAFDTTDPDEYAKSLQDVSDKLDEGVLNVDKLNDEVKKFDKNVDQSGKNTKRKFTVDLPNVLKRGASVAGQVLLKAGALIAAGLATIIGTFTAIIGAAFARAVDRVPSVRKNWEQLQSQIKKVGDYIAAQLAPLFNRLIGIASDFIKKIDFKQVIAAVNAFVITVENLVTAFLSLFGIDINGFGETAGGVFNKLIGYFIEFNRQFAGFQSAFKEILNRIQVFILAFTVNVLQGIDALLPGKQFDRAINNLQKKILELRENSFQTVAEAFKAGVDDFDKRLAAAQASVENFDSFKAFGDKVKKGIEVAVGSLQFFQEQIDLLRADAERTVPEIAAVLLREAELIERRMQEVERGIKQRLDNIRGILRQPIDILATTGADTSALREVADKQAREYADALIAASKAVANETIAPRLQAIAADVQKRLSSGQIVITPNVKDTISELQDQYKDSLEIIDRLEKLYKAAAEKRAADLVARKQEILDTIDAVSQYVDAIGGAVNELGDAFASSIDKQIEKLDELVKAQEGRVQKATTLAEKGNAEILQLEEQRLDKILQAREQALQRERSLAAAQQAVNQAIAISQGIVAITKAFAEGNVVGGIAASIALAGALAAIVVTLSDAFSGIPTFYQGEEWIPGNERDLRYIGVHGKERVVPAKYNKQIPRTLPNERLPELITLGLAVERNAISKPLLAPHSKIDPSVLPSTVIVDMAGLERKMEQNTEQIRALAKRMQKLDPIVMISKEDIHGANEQVSLRKQRRKAFFK